MYTQHDAMAMLANRAQTTSMVGQAAFYPGSKFSQPAATLNVDDKTSIGPLIHSSIDEGWNNGAHLYKPPVPA